MQSQPPSSHETHQEARTETASEDGSFMRAAAACRVLAGAIELLDSDTDLRHRAHVLKLVEVALQRLGDAELVDLDLRDGHAWARTATD